MPRVRSLSSSLLAPLLLGGCAVAGVLREPAEADPLELHQRVAEESLRHHLRVTEEELRQHQRDHEAAMRLHQEQLPPPRPPSSQLGN